MLQYLIYCCLVFDPAEASVFDPTGAYEFNPASASVFDPAGTSVFGPTGASFAPTGVSKFELDGLISLGIVIFLFS